MHGLARAQCFGLREFRDSGSGRRVIIKGGLREWDLFRASSVLTLWVTIR